MPSTRRSCQLGTLFRRCHQPAETTCVYCGRRFCLSHGRRQGEGMDICNATRCQLKADDLGAHQSYVERGGQRNRFGLCATEDCDTRYASSCSSCGRLFCDEHVSSREDRMATSRDQAVVSTCEHCWRRRALWRRRR